MATLIKVDRNGSKHYEGLIECDRCQGRGVYWWGGMINGRPRFAGTCFKCGGDGKVVGKWIERTPEYEAKLAAKREAKWAAEQAKRDAERAMREAEQAKRDAEEAARKAISQYVGQVGEKIVVEATYEYTGSWEAKSFAGYGTETNFIHGFKDARGNLFVWRTTSTGLGDFEKGQAVVLAGTIKEHTEYKGEKQTALTRVKVKGAA